MAKFVHLDELVKLIYDHISNDFFRMLSIEVKFAIQRVYTDTTEYVIELNLVGMSSYYFVGTYPEKIEHNDFDIVYDLFKKGFLDTLKKIVPSRLVLDENRTGSNGAKIIIRKSSFKI